MAGWKLIRPLHTLPAPSSMAQSLSGKRIVLTGSTGRLGRKIIEAYKDTEASLITIDRAINMDLVEQNDHILLATIADVTDEQAVVDCFAHILDETGPPDMVIHTIGGWDGRPFLNTSLESWQSLININLTSSFLVFREAIRHMHEGGGGLIGITSAQGADRGVAEQAAYAASKGGLTRLIEAIAAEYKGTGITAHAVAPSMILYEEPYDKSGVPATDVASLCVYLSTHAGRALNGATLRAYGA